MHMQEIIPLDEFVSFMAKFEGGVAEFVETRGRIRGNIGSISSDQTLVTVSISPAVRRHFGEWIPYGRAERSVFEPWFIVKDGERVVIMTRDADDLVILYPKGVLQAI